MRVVSDKNHISELKQGDIIYISKTEKGYQIIYECKFFEFRKGIINADAIKTNDYSLYQPKKITARLTKCFLWKFDKGHGGNRCHWFDKAGDCR